MPSFAHTQLLRKPRTFAKWVISSVLWHIHTALLFTWTDYKTIMFPIAAFASATAPVCSPLAFIQACGWIFFHLLLCNVSNQANTSEEDAVNRPWRPLPSGRVTQTQARALRWGTVGICLFLSSFYGLRLVGATTYLAIVTMIYDEGGLAGHPIGKNLCAVGGYSAFEIGATMLMGSEKILDKTSLYAIALSGAIIITTIHAQDFPDVEGDAALGRITLPIFAPEFSRWFMFLATLLWSICLPAFWELGRTVSGLFVLLGLYVGGRYYFYRDVKTDKRSYLIYNVWLVLAHLQPLHARTGVLAF